ncbi:MAG: O-antigen ligase family protein [Oscillospiraceae bacterium]
MKKAVLNKNKEKFNLFFIPIILVLTVVPLLVRLAVIEIDYDTFNIFGKSPQTDMFSQYKALFLLICVVLMILVSATFFKRLVQKKEFHTTIYLISSVVFIFFAFLSAIFSNNKEVAFQGLFSHAEGFITIVCYIAIFLYTIFVFKETNNYTYIILPLVLVVGLNAMIGIFQYIGQDIYNTQFGVHLVVPNKYINADTNFNQAYASGKMNGTFSHYNYMGSFAAMMIPLFTVLTIFEKHTRNKMVLGISALLSCLLLFGSTSRAGIIGLLATGAFTFIIFLKKIIKGWETVTIIVGALAVMIVGLNIATNGGIFERVPALINDGLSIFSNTKNFDYKDHIPVRDVQHKNDNILITSQSDVLEVSYNGKELVFKDSQNNLVNYTQNNNVYIIQNKSFEGYSFKIGGKSESSTRYETIIFLCNEAPLFSFNISETNNLHLANPFNFQNIELQDPPHIGFAGREKIGSMRGYIWSRTLPLLKNNMIIGCGPDNFIFKFPQNDFLGKYYAYETTNMVVDKPHNLFLQIFVNNGGIAFLAFMTIIITYIIDCLKLYAIKKHYSNEQGLGIASFLAVIGYLFAGLFNDSAVSVSPIFWIVFGAGVAINTINRNKLKVS